MLSELRISESEFVFC